MRSALGVWLAALSLGSVAACSTPATPLDSGRGDAQAGTDGGTPGSDAGSGDDAASPGDDAATGDDAGTTGTDAGPGVLPSGWLYTQGNHVLVSDGAGGGSVWVGRGVNMDDVFLCGYNYGLWMSTTDVESALEAMADAVVVDWHASFVRVSLGMDSYTPQTDWVTSPAEYAAPMTSFVHAIGAHPGTYVLVALRSHPSMILEDEIHGDPEATGIPSDATTTPDGVAFPRGTDPTYEALVDSFANDPYVLFGITNEAGGNLQSDATIAAAMAHAVDVIRAEEDRLGVPHHLISVQGNDWTSDVSYYESHPIGGSDVVYEIHGYPPTSAMYTSSTLPIVIGEYGTLSDATAFFADLEAKQIPNLAWDFEAYSDCTPDLLAITHDATMLNRTPWGDTVHAYLTAH